MKKIFKIFLKQFPFFDSCGCQAPDYVVGTWQSTNRLGWACRNCGGAYTARKSGVIRRKEVVR